MRTGRTAERGVEGGGTIGGCNALVCCSLGAPGDSAVFGSRLRCNIRFTVRSTSSRQRVDNDDDEFSQRDDNNNAGGSSERGVGGRECCSRRVYLCTHKNITLAHTHARTHSALFRPGSPRIYWTLSACGAMTTICDMNKKCVCIGMSVCACWVNQMCVCVCGACAFAWVLCSQ